MLNQFSRTELLLGKEAMEKLGHSRVASLVSAASEAMSATHLCGEVWERLI